MKFLLRCAVLLCILPILTYFPGCNGAEEGYRKYVQKDWFAHFSFEYPKDYKKAIFDVHEDETIVSFVRSPKSSENVTLLTLSVIVIQPEPPDYTNAGEYLDHLITTLYNAENGYRVDKKASVTVADTEGMQVAISSVSDYAHQEDISPDEIEAAPLMENDFRIVYFDRDGLIWTLSIQSFGGFLGDDNTAWSHFLKTFQVLE